MNRTELMEALFQIADSMKVTSETLASMSQPCNAFRRSDESYADLFDHLDRYLGRLQAEVHGIYASHDGIRREVERQHAADLQAEFDAWAETAIPVAADPEPVRPMRVTITESPVAQLRRIGEEV